MHISYPSDYEYKPKERKYIEVGIKAYFQSQPLEITWYKRNDPNNVYDKIDASIVLLNDYRVIHNQIKSSRYEETFSIGKYTMRDYLNEYHNLEALIVATLKHKRIYFFNWFEFVDLAHEMINSWTLYDNKFYVIPIDDLTKNMRYKSFRYK